MSGIFQKIDYLLSQYMPPVTRRIFLGLWVIWLGFLLLAATLPGAGQFLQGLLALQPVDIFPRFMLWQFATYGLMHGSFGHILLNSLALFFFGGPVERTLGGRRYLWFLLLAVVAGGMAHTIIYWIAAVVADQPGYAAMGLIGFSGAVFAILVACYFIVPNATVYIYFILPMKLKHLVIILLIIEAVWAVSSGLDAGISHIGHLAGAGAGFVLIRFPGILNWLAGRGGGGGGGRRLRGGKRVSSPLSYGHPGRSKNASELYDDPHWRLDQ